MSLRARTNSPTETNMTGRINLQTAEAVAHNAGESGGDEVQPKPLFKVTTGQ
jgi:hypothetical protein